jgi:ribonucleoside-triphosphate reductase
MERIDYIKYPQRKFVMKKLPTLYQDFIHLSRYSRWLPEENRRETWEETVSRYFDFFEDHLSTKHDYKVSTKQRKELEEAVLNLEIMPSMRALMTAGEALKRDNVAGYNCSYVAVNRLRAFDEILYVLMCGTGVGFSVERAEVDQLPMVSEEFHETDTTIVVADSKVGWSKAYKELVSLLVNGQVPKWDVSKVRAAGERLKTFGGRASGPAPLVDLFEFTVNTFKKAAGRRLTTIECHDIVCKIAEIVVVGGVRRSALISLSSLMDDRMRDAKSGQWWMSEPQRALANNSAVYNGGPTEIGTFMKEWMSLYESKSGERGIFNRSSAKNQCKKVAQDRGEGHVHRDPDHRFGTNPCSEIILRDAEFCNLTEIVVREDDTVESLKRKIRLATILGTWQSTLTNFRYLSSSWKNNCEEERLLGVSLTGIMDCETTRCTDKLEFRLDEMRRVCVDTNKEFAKKIGIPQSAATTCVKPSGTVSQLVDAASGIHARHNDYYIRTVRADNKDPLCSFMKDKGFPHEADVMKPDNVTVFSFPTKSPAGCVTRSDMTAIEQLELWLIYQRHWCEHKPSVTISVKEHEWMEVGAWVWKHLDEISGISFLPFSDHVYKQAPYQDIDEETYIRELEKLPQSVNWEELANYEKEDNTSGSQTYACSGDSCEVVDLT